MLLYKYEITNTPYRLDELFRMFVRGHVILLDLASTFYRPEI